jgi:hypothetical protein
LSNWHLAALAKAMLKPMLSLDHVQRNGFLLAALDPGQRLAGLVQGL